MTARGTRAGTTSGAKSSIDRRTSGVRIEKVVLVGDRGMLTSARKSDRRRGWISALRGDQIEALVPSGDLQLGLFDEHNLVEIVAPKFPGAQHE